MYLPRQFFGICSNLATELAGASNSGSQAAAAAYNQQMHQQQNYQQHQHPMTQMMLESTQMLGSSAADQQY